MWNFAIRASSSDRSAPVQDREHGATLAELLVVLVIVSTLAVTALPLAETTVRRQQESTLREALRTVRTAIDRFNADWRAGRMAGDADGVSENGYPETLTVLVSGVEAEDADDPALRYLRRVPRNPFSAEDRPIAEHWRLIGYAQDAGGAEAWNGEDVYDLRPATERTALDGTEIADW